MLLRAMLSAQSAIAVVGEAGNGQEAIDLGRELRPDVMLLDISMPVMDGIEALPQILTASPATSDPHVVGLFGTRDQGTGAP